ncbi:hypothetical protein D3C85_1306440 [compost metagenome]
MRAGGHHVQVAVEQHGAAARASRFVARQHVVAPAIGAAGGRIQRQVLELFRPQRNALGTQAQVGQRAFQELGGGHFLAGQAAALHEPGQRIGHVLAKFAHGSGDLGLVKAGCCDGGHCIPLLSMKSMKS